jgi:hypothetical protein
MDKYRNKVFNNTIYKSKPKNRSKNRPKNLELLFFYWGEFGHFNVRIINALSYAMKYNYIYKILTYNDYGLLLKYLFPKRIKLFPVDNKVMSLLDNTTRAGHRAHGSVAMQKYEQKLGILDSLENLYCYHNDNVLKEILTTKNLGFINQFRKDKLVNKESKFKENKNISIFARNRNICNYKNISKDEWLTIIKHIKSQGFPIISHGLDNETFDVGGLKINKIMDSIYFLNNCLFYIGVNSGFTQFALNCGIKRCFMVDYQGEFRRVYSAYNPFNTEIIYFDNVLQLLAYLSKYKVINDK